MAFATDIHRYGLEYIFLGKQEKWYLRTDHHWPVCFFLSFILYNLLQRMRGGRVLWIYKVWLQTRQWMCHTTWVKLMLILNFLLLTILLEWCDQNRKVQNNTYHSFISILIISVNKCSEGMFEFYKISLMLFFLLSKQIFTQLGDWLWSIKNFTHSYAYICNTFWYLSQFNP